MYLKIKIEIIKILLCDLEFSSDRKIKKEKTEESPPQVEPPEEIKQ